MNETLLQLGGRLHPLLLHMPIGVLGALVVLELWGVVRRRPVDRAARLLLVWLLALAAAMSVGSGILLSEEPGYVGDTIEVHRWLGIGTAALALLAAIFATVGFRRGYTAAMALAVLLVIPAGHLGATMTHGADFLTAPFDTAPRVLEASSDDVPGAVVAAASDDVGAILETHCAQCHGARRRKGGLALHTPDVIAAGLGDGVAEELRRRIRLPVSDDDHMPPDGKPQLLAAQIETLSTWIASGAWIGRVAAVAPAAPAPAAASALPVHAVHALRAARVHVEIIDPESNLLWIDFTAAPAIGGAEAVMLLAPLAAFTEELSLRGVEAANEIITEAGPWPRLRRIDLSRTNVQRDGLAAATESGDLEELVLVEARLGPEAESVLISSEGIARVYVWGAALSDEALADLRVNRPGLTIDDGSAAPPPPLEVEPVVAMGTPKDAVSLASVNTTCPVSGQPVVAKYSVVHEGRVVAFCCEVCAGKFWADPASFTIEVDRPSE